MLSRELARGWLAITSATLLGDMAKASRVLAALMRDGWVEARRRGSHRVLVNGDLQRVWAYHDGADLGGPALARVGKQFGYPVEQLRGL